MSVNVELSSFFGRYTDNHLHIKVEGSTTGECLDDLIRQFPKLKRLLFDKYGNFHHGYDLFVNGESVYPMGLKKPVKDGDKMNVVFIIQGG